MCFCGFPKNGQSATQRCAGRGEAELVEDARILGSVRRCTSFGRTALFEPCALLSLEKGCGVWCVANLEVLGRLRWRKEVSG